MAYLLVDEMVVEMEYLLASETVAMKEMKQAALLAYKMDVLMVHEKASMMDDLTVS